MNCQNGNGLTGPGNFCGFRVHKRFVFSKQIFKFFQTINCCRFFCGDLFFARIFVQNAEDFKKIIPFFLSSSVIVVLYGIWQNVRFAQSFSSFEVMPGRPNATFTEPVWLGIFVIFLIAILYSMIYYFSKSNTLLKDVQIFKIFLYIILTSSYTILILTVSRSAWLGALVVTFAYLFIIWTNLKISSKNWQWKFAIRRKLEVISSLIIAVAIVYFFNLTSFQLFNRAQSTGTGLQKITVSCKENIALPEKVAYSEELIRYGCRHINLEEIKLEQVRGYYIKEIFRQDPNVSIRSEIYQKSWQEIKNHPVLGIGWGSIGNILGKDERGTNLNSSNIFLEIWLGSGFLGLASFLLFWSYILVASVKAFCRKQQDFAAYSLFLFLAWIALIVPNLFNAGVFLGLFWVFSGISISLLNYKEE